MPFHFESNIEDEDNIKDSEYRKNYGQGYVARVEGKKVGEMPFKDPESLEAKAQYEGYNDARPSEEKEEIKKLQEWYEI